MTTIYKYVLKLEREQLLDLPKDAYFLHVGQQGDHLVVWAKLDPTAPKDERRIWIFGTGGAVPDDRCLVPIGTVQMDSGLVWHVFEEL